MVTSTGAIRQIRIGIVGVIPAAVEVPITPTHVINIPKK
jgi:hypothetical protein